MDTQKTEGENPIVLTIKVGLRSEDIESLVISAFEGGSNYWYKNLDWEGNGRYHDVFMQGGTLTFDEYDEDNKFLVRHSFNLKKAKKGLQMMTTRCPFRLANIMNEEADATDADVFLQLSTLGKIKYG